jgi:arylformamidase
MSREIWLSYPLAIDDPRPPAIPAPELTTLYTIDADAAAVQILRVASHTGTHVDAPRHVVAEGLCLLDFAPEEFVFTRPLVLDLRLAEAAVVTPEDLQPWESQLRPADLALLRFGYGEIRRTDPERYSLRAPGLGIPAARWLREHAPGLRALGLDVPSLACIACLDETMAAHAELLGGPGRRFLVIEDMDLAADLGMLHRVRLCPWLVRGMDSGPCAVVGTLTGGGMEAADAI